VLETEDGYLVTGETRTPSYSHPTLTKLNSSGGLEWGKEYETDWNMSRNIIKVEDGYSMVASKGHMDEGLTEGAGIINVDSGGELVNSISFGERVAEGAWGLSENEDSYIAVGATTDAKRDTTDGWLVSFRPLNTSTDTQDAENGTEDSETDTQEMTNTGQEDGNSQNGSDEGDAEDTESMPGFGAIAALLAFSVYATKRLR
jgi:hypothetical protein